MSRNRNLHPPYSPRFEVGIGRHANQWFVNVKSSVSTELLVAAGGQALSGWTVEALDEITGATVLASLVDTTYEQASQTAVALTIGIARETGKSGIYSPAVVDMVADTALINAL